jgi:aspartyl-tRNA(Asn)/glutamyl-tRNA(Gln) amidotransferase subunit C
MGIASPLVSIRQTNAAYSTSRLAMTGITSGYNFSMSLTLKEVEHIATLARLELTEEQKVRYTEQLSHILNYIAKLQELDTSNVPPTNGGGSVPQMPLRADEARPSLDREQLLANTNHKENNQFKIPPVFE